MRALLVLLALLWAAPAFASIHGSFPTVNASCPQTGSALDGCAGSPGGTVQHSNFFTSYALQSGQSYATRPNWNVAGVEYGVGNYTVQGSLADPSTLNSGPCQYNATGGVFGGAAVVCQSSASPVTISGIDFSRHNCTQLVIKTSYTGTLTVNNNYWLNGSNCNGSGGTGAFISQSNFGSACIVLTSNTFDGDAPAFTTGMTNLVVINSSCGPTIEYDAFLRAPARTLGVHTNASFVVQWNYFEGWIYLPYQGHGEVNVFATQTTSPPLVAFNFNTVIEPSGACACSTTTIYTSSGSGDAWNNWDVKNNTVVANLVGGSSGTGSGTFTIDNGLGTGPGDVLTITGITTGAVGRGMSFTSTAFTGTLFLSANLSGSGVGSTWTTVCTGTLASPAAPCSGSVNPSLQISGTYAQSGFSVGPAGSETAHDTFNQITFANNYVDGTGGTSLFQAISGAVCTNPSIFTSNINLVSGATITGYTATTGGC